MTGEFQYKKDIIEIGRRLYAKGFVASNDGNISVRIGPSRILTTVTGVSKGFLSSDDIALVDHKGKKLAGKGEPSSELKMHLLVYERRPDLSAVVHAHPPVSTGFAVAGIPLAQCILPEVVVSLGSVPVAPYGTPSTYEVCDALAPLLENGEAFLLANHGVVTFGKDLFQAYYRMETVEHFARILLTARLLGNVNVLTREQVAKILEVRKAAGITGRFPDCESCGYCSEGTGTSGVSRVSGGSSDIGATGRAPEPRGAGKTVSGEEQGKVPPLGELPQDKALVNLIASVIRDMTQEKGER